MNEELRIVQNVISVSIFFGNRIVLFTAFADNHMGQKRLTMFYGTPGLLWYL